MDANIQGEFQVCISVPLRKFCLFYKIYNRQSPLSYLTIVSIEFHRNPQTNILSEAVAIVKFLFSDLKTVDLKITFSPQL